MLFLKPLVGFVCKKSDYSFGSKSFCFVKYGSYYTKFVGLYFEWMKPVKRSMYKKKTTTTKNKRKKFMFLIIKVKTKI